VLFLGAVPAKPGAAPRNFDYGDGPAVAGDNTRSFCAWFSWSKFRVVLPILDKTLPTVIAYRVPDVPVPRSTKTAQRRARRRPSLWLFGWRQALFSLAGGQYGSEGGVRQPRAEAWSIRVRVARATIGRVSSAR
jgi:hypothetical protein